MKKKIIINLGSLILRKKHTHFLKFWFKNDNDLDFD